jgi:hypothetical protein
MLPPSVVGGGRDTSEYAEAHCSVPQRVMAGRANGTEASRVGAGDGAIDAIENASRRRSRCQPAPFTRDGIRIELTTTGCGDCFDGSHVGFVVRECELFRGGVPSLEMFYEVKKLRHVAQRTGNRAQASDVLVMAPPRIVAATVTVRDERGTARAHRAFGLRRYDTGRRRRSAMRRMEPFFTPAWASVTFSLRISKPWSLTTNSLADGASG